MLLPLLLAGCNPSYRITGMDVSNIYTGNKQNELHLQHIFHINDSISTLRIAIPSGLILPDPGSRHYSKQGKLVVEIINNGKQISLSDSASFPVYDTTLNRAYLYQDWTFKAPAGLEYFVKATYSVPGMPEDLILLEYFSKLNHDSPAWYRFQSANGTFIPRVSDVRSDSCRLVSCDSGKRLVQVMHFPVHTRLAVPPFAEQQSLPPAGDPDTAFTIELNKGETSYFTMPQPGLYFFQTNPALHQGPSIFCTNPGFPKITRYQQMLECLRYITTSNEYQQLSATADTKMAIDSFWLQHAGNEARALEQIHNYYSRAEIANTRFTSYTDGWQTDRGMIYIVVGKPDMVFRSFEQEVWIYGDYEDVHALRFYFTKIKNTFTENDYVLLRDPEFKTIWYQYVQLWRR